MKIAYFDTIAGVSGDMTLGAFISAGMAVDELLAEIGKLHLQGVELEVSHVIRNGITAVKLDVVISSVEKHHRYLKDIVNIIDESSLSERVKENAKKIFIVIAKAEAKVHNIEVEKIHFHEVGALDSIVDIVGTAICLEHLGIEKIYSSPVRLGSGGFADTEHGKLPIPTPATIEILKEYPAILTDIPFELTTPTGAAIIRTLSSGVLSTEQFTVERIGYGAGTREFSAFPNVLRIMIGELSTEYEKDNAVLIETNIDNMNPEIYPYVIEKLLSGGAHDAYMTPIIMKKGRPGILLSVISPQQKTEDMLEVLFSQTSTLGVRILPTERRKLHRDLQEVRTTLGVVKVKAVTLNGKVRLIPEYEECRRIAEEQNLPLMEIYRIFQAELDS